MKALSLDGAFSFKPNLSTLKRGKNEKSESERSEEVLSSTERRVSGIFNPSSPTLKFKALQICEAFFISLSGVFGWHFLKFKVYIMPL